MACRCRRRASHTATAIFLLFSWFNRGRGSEKGLACKNCHEKCEIFSNWEGTKTFSPYGDYAECEWIISPTASKKLADERHQNVSINLWFSLFETELYHDFLEVHACEDHSCASSISSVIGRFSGTRTGMNLTVSAGAVLLRLSSDGNKINARGFCVHWTTAVMLEKDVSAEIGRAEKLFEPMDADIATNRRQSVSIPWLIIQPLQGTCTVMLRL
jgi:hypothetical protein